MKNISARLAYAIGHSGRSKGALAKHLGVPQSNVSRWLAGAEPRTDRLSEIAKFLGVDVNWLVTGEESQTPEISGNVVREGNPNHFQAPESEIMRVEIQKMQLQLKAAIDSAAFSIAELETRMKNAGAWPASNEDRSLTPGQLWIKYAPYPKMEKGFNVSVTH